MTALVQVKICGINSDASFDAAADAGADWVGFVFFPPSPRAVSPAEAAAISSRRRGGPLRVGLFVTPEDADVAAVLSVVPLDVLQVHASPERVAALGRRFGRPVWLAHGVATAADLPVGTVGIDGLLLDAKPTPGATLPGGNARAFDWQILRGWTAPSPWLLAGGLTPDTVADAIRVSGAQAVDVSSGVESARGVKDASLIRSFVHRARCALD